MSRILITGASGTLGSELLKRLRPTGHEVWTVGRRPCSGIARHLVADLGDTGSVERLCSLLAELPAVDVAVLCAAVDSELDTSNLSAAAFRQAMAVNCLSQLQMLGCLRTAASDCPLRVVAASTRVLERRSARSALYAMTKAAFETGLMFAALDPGRAVEVHVRRLPFLGVPMRNLVELPGKAPQQSDGARPHRSTRKFVETVFRLIA